MAPWWCFPCKPKHAGAVLLILKCFNNSTFFNIVCISWKLKCWILLMHGVTVKFITNANTRNLKHSGKILSLSWIQKILTPPSNIQPYGQNIYSPPPWRKTWCCLCQIIKFLLTVKWDFSDLEYGRGTVLFELLVIVCEMFDHVYDHAFCLDSQLVFLL